MAYPRSGERGYKACWGGSSRMIMDGPSIRSAKRIIVSEGPYATVCARWKYSFDPRMSAITWSSRPPRSRKSTSVC